MSFLNKSIVAGVASAFLGSSLFLAPAHAADEKKPAAKSATEAKAGDKEKEPAKPVAKDDGAKDAKGEKDEAKSDKPVKLTKPWSDLTLTDEQKVKIKAIHTKALAEINAIEKTERTDIEALLTDAQKTELAELKKKPKKPAADKDADEKKSDEKKPAAK